MATTPQRVTPVIIFYSYAHEDESLREELETHLSLLKRQGLLSEWHDRQIRAGQKWADEISTHLDTADVILLLVSANFLASDYCWSQEMRRALERQQAGQAWVIPIILRSVDWHSAPFSSLQALPRNAKPITSWPNRDEAWTDVARGIRLIIEGDGVSPKSEEENSTPDTKDSPDGSIHIGESVSGNEIITEDPNVTSVVFSKIQQLAQALKGPFPFAALALVLGVILTILALLPLSGVVGGLYMAKQDVREIERAYELGKFNIDNEHWIDAIDYLRKIPESHSYYRVAVSYLGMALLKLKRHREALDAYQQAEKSSKDDHERLNASYNVALVRLDAREYKRAAEDFRTLLGTTQMRDDPAVIINAAIALYLNGETKDAQSILDRILFEKSFPEGKSERDLYAKAYRLRARLNLKKGASCDQMILDLNMAEKLKPELKEAIEKEFSLCISKQS